MRLGFTYDRSFVWPYSKADRGYICFTFICSASWEHRENRLRQANHRITLPQPLREGIGQRWTTFHFSQRLNPSEQFLSQASPGSPQHIHYSCERQGEHVGKLGLAADLWCLINGVSVLRLGNSGPESCWVLKWWSDKQRNGAKTNISSIQLFIFNWKGRAQSRTSDLIWRIAPALWIYQMRQQDKTGGFLCLKRIISFSDMMIVWVRTTGIYRLFTDYLLMWCAYDTHHCLTVREMWSSILQFFFNSPDSHKHAVDVFQSCLAADSICHMWGLGDQEPDNHVCFLCPPIMTN